MTPLLERWFGGDLEAAQPEPAPRGRRDRPVVADDPNTAVLAQKVLHAWLQNRHQTLFPLTVNLRGLVAAQVVALAELMAIAARAAGAPDPVSIDRSRAWFAQVGADAAGLSAFDAAQEAVPAMHPVIAAMRDGGLAATGYVAALVAIEQRDPAAAPFLEYLATRLGLPATVLRSAHRRYGR